ncbi:MAG: hypothetical protein IKR76_09705 [Ruminococcus sp.]|nr:hypothetical protein [Ruminococcus sp.]
MAFIGISLLFLILLAAVAVAVIAGVVLIIIGTRLIKDPERKKLGVTLRIVGYLVSIPTVSLAIIIAAAFMMSGTK